MSNRPSPRQVPLTYWILAESIERERERVGLVANTKHGRTRGRL